MFNKDLNGLPVCNNIRRQQGISNFNLRKLSAKHTRFRAKINEPDNQSQVLTQCNCRDAFCHCVVTTERILNLLEKTLGTAPRKKSPNIY